VIEKKLTYLTTGSLCTADDGFRPHIDGESCISGDSSISDIVFLTEANVRV